MSRMLFAAAAVAALMLLPAAASAARKHTPIEKGCAAQWKQCVNGCGGGPLCSVHCDDSYHRCLSGEPSLSQTPAATAPVRAKPAAR